MAISFKKKAAPEPKATVTKELSEKGVKVSEEQTEEKPATKTKPVKNTEVPWCTVGVEASYTHNLGNYQSAKVGVSIQIPCEHAEIDTVFEVAKAWIDDRMQVLIKEVSAE